ncbi:MAG: hypothetical protein WBJ06_06970 [Candidatus Methanoculleus thermohydrogenotrophicum]|jgi:hypothetical protein
MGYVGIPAAALFADVSVVEHVSGLRRASASSGYKVAMLDRGSVKPCSGWSGATRILRAGSGRWRGGGR